MLGRSWLNMNWSYYICGQSEPVCDCGNEYRVPVGFRTLMRRELRAILIKRLLVHSLCSDQIDDHSGLSELKPNHDATLTWSLFSGELLIWFRRIPFLYDMIEDFNVDSKAECGQLNLAHVARNKKI